MAPKKDYGPRRLIISPRTVTYGIAWFLILGFTVGELGLVSEQLHKYGETYENYASKGYKHTIGLLLFASLWSLLTVLAHPWMSVGATPVASLVNAVFFGTGAGLMRTLTPFGGAFCDIPATDYPEAWQPYAHECTRIVTIQGLAWGLWALYILLGVGALFHKVEFRARPATEGFYHSKP